MAPTAARAAASAYVQLGRDAAIAAPTVVLSASISLDRSDNVLVASDGWYRPVGPADASVHIEIDGQRISDDSLIDWRGSTNLEPHSFDAIGAANLPAGAHTITLVADSPAGQYVIGRGANLSVMIHPADHVQVSELGADTRRFDFTTAGVVTATDGSVTGAPAPHTAVLTQSIAALNAPIVALGSLRAYQDGGAGDAMAGIYADGQNLGNGAANWSVNDLFSGAELQAPMYTHALIPATAAPRQVSLDATEFPWNPNQNGGEDPVMYRIGAGARLVTLWGGLDFYGAASSSDRVNDWYDYIGIGADHPYGNVPPTGTDVPIATTALSIPPGRTGTVFFSAQTRVQGDSADSGGQASLWISIDGARVGSTAVQQLSYPNSDSQRTLTASYLATALSPGVHQIQVFARADGSFKHLAVTADAPLIYFGHLSSPPPPIAALLGVDLSHTARRLRVSSSGAVTIVLRCAPSGPGAVPPACRVRIVLDTVRTNARRQRRSLQRLAARTVTLGIGRYTRIRLRLPRRALHALGARRAPAVLTSFVLGQTPPHIAEKLVVLVGPLPRRH